ncbi:SpoIIE family protein phosphatase [Amycolatopsis regifaucium]|uniref:PAS sensor protein n=1 Tax=Amycolatopsis regifaucium TaxID=546365 RepID=A0A154M3P6_9PSEU|nr:SpoIIE family protein phosphatase [Amycolatopsis regifaucium]KZB79231.1 PAS sensor protein [Amycolatopsis regifaucium]OKA07414.1 PAS sensor protein [Amycolatopsis regifaucium]SFH12002.1 anti-anti-sigma factor [Amycolatopsis regifaucium]
METQDPPPGSGDGGQDLLDVVGGSPVVVWQADVQSGAYSFVSEGCRRLLGHPAAAWLADPAFAISLVHPEDRGRYRRVRAQGWARPDYDLTYRAIAADGRIVWLQELGRVLPGGVVSGVLLDVSGRRLETERHQFLAEFERGLQELEDAEQVMAYAARSLGDHLDADRCAYAEAEDDEDHFLMSGDHATGLPPLPGRFAMSEFGKGCLRAMRAGLPWIVADSAEDDRLEESDLNAYQVTGIRAVICVPLLRGGRFVAAMAVHQATVRHWTEAEIGLVEMIVNRCWESIQRTHAGRALRDSEQRYRLLVERATDAIWMLDRDLGFDEINPAACELLGYSRDELIGTPITDLLENDGSDRWREFVADLGKVWETSDVHHFRRADGTGIALELSVQATPSGVQAIGRDVTERRRREAERDLMLQRERDIAETLQQSLLPRELPALSRIAAAARYLPVAAHAQTGGDWYELISLGGSVVALSVGDVVGKGPQAAAIMGQLRSALAVSLLDGHGPAAALQRLDAFAARIEGASGTTCACLTLDWETGELRWALAGHPPPVVVDGSTATLLPGGSSVLGGPRRSRYREETATLDPGASVLLYTDGLIERRDEHIDEGLRRLCETLTENRSLSPEPLVATIIDNLLDSGQQDDVALLGLRLTPPPLRRSRTAEPGILRELRAEVVQWSQLAGISAELYQDLNLALVEAVANSIEHAYSQTAGEVAYSVARTATGKVEVVVTDHGTWRPEPADNGHRGRGIQLIKALAEEAAIEQNEHGTTVRFRIPTSAARTVPPVLAAGPAMDVPVDDTPGEPVLRLTGDLDLATTADARQALLHRIETADAPELTIDLTGVRYLSSCGIALLLDAAGLASGLDTTLTVLTTAGSMPLRILELAGLTGPGSDPLTVETVPAPSTN